MSATTVTPVRHNGLGVVVRDAMAVARRYLLHYRRQPQLLVFSTIQPVMFVLLFNYVFGGAFENVPGLDNYTNFLLPGIFVQSIAFGSTQTAVGLSEDLAAGVVDRFRSLPMARSAVLMGRTLSDLLRGTFVVTLMTLVGIAIGFRPRFFGLLGAIALVVAFGFALSWLFAFVGLSVKGTETAQAASFVATFPLVFASSVFTPIETFPGWLQAFARANPITQVAAASRALAAGIGPIGNHVWFSLLWIVVLLAVFVPLSVRRYGRG